MKYWVLAFGLLALAGCTPTISQQELESMRATASPSKNTVPGRSNELRYMGTKDGYDYYYFYKRGTFDTENTYRVATSGASDNFAYTSNQNQWRPLYASQAAPTVLDKGETLITIEGKTYRLVPTTEPTTAPATNAKDSHS